MKSRVAHAISILGYPYVLIPLVVFAGGQSDRSVGLTMLAAFALVAAITSRKAARGDYSNFDVSTRDQRPSMYWMLIAAVGLMWLWLASSNPQHPAVKGLGIALLMLLACFALNAALLKVSLHVAFAVYAAAMAQAQSQSTWIVMGLAIFAGLVAWSRVVLKRHTLVEVLAGGAVGAFGSAALLWMHF